ncbi:MAG: response regulator [Candidatus Omnitrophica bacterium]|nr:response regulator [Candidatus Omnitrophota bacterium]
MKILIIDDEQVICESIARNLKRIGFMVFTETDGNKALEVVKQEQPEMILLDLVLQGADGFELLSEIKSFRSEIIIIVITALKDEESQARAMKEGADDFLTKPFRTEELRKTIKQKIESVLLSKDKMEIPSVLLVDDSEEYRQQITKFLTNHYQMTLSEAKDGTSAVKMIKDHAYDLVILDIKMPGQDGIKVLNEIKDALPLTSVIVLSGWSDKQIVLQAMNAGVFAYISKSEPNIFDELKEKVESILISQGKLIKSSP